MDTWIETKVLLNTALNLCGQPIKTELYSLDDVGSDLIFDTCLISN